MKINAKQLRLIASIVSFVGIVIFAMANSYNNKHPEHPLSYGVYLGIGIALLGIVLQGPWIKEEK